MAWRYSAAWRRPSLVLELEGERSAASTMNIMPFRFWGWVMLANAWWRSFPCPGVSARKKRLWTWREGSCAERYCVDEVLVVMGRETSTVSGAWEVRVSACWPRSNYMIVGVRGRLSLLRGGGTDQSEEGGLSGAAGTNEEDSGEVCG